MTKTRKFWAHALCVPAAVLCALPFAALAQGGQQYISDEISVTIRQKPSNDAESVGAVKSGQKVTVLESLGNDSFAHIRTADGREGWITARFVSGQPAAKDQLVALRQQLDQAHAQAQSLQHDLDNAQQGLAKAKPALDMAAENEKLRAAMAEREQQVGALEQQYDGERARRQTLLLGAVLVAGGIVVGLLLPWMGTRKKRYSDF